MRTRRLGQLLACAFLATIAAPASASAEDAIVPGEVIVRFTSDRGLAAHVDRLGGDLKRDLGLPGMVTMKVDRDTDTEALAKQLEARSDVLWAEPNTRMTLAAAPNDPRFGDQWGLSNLGQLVRGRTGIAGIDANVATAWDAFTGGDAVIAVVDSGVSLLHPDLADNIWSNPGETGIDSQGRDKRTNGFDDDGNTRVDDWRGWDFISNDNDPSDLNGHGTNLAGIIGAVGNNGLGIAGINWRTKIMPLRVGSTSRTDGSINADAAAAAFAYAGSKGVKVVNASFSGTSPTQAQEDAIAANPDTLFVTAAGNDGTDNDTTPKYPCNFNRANIICVGAITNNAGLTSNFGNKSVDLAAPGGDLVTTTPFTINLDEPFETPVAGRWTPVPAFNNGTWESVARTNGDGKRLTLNNGNGVSNQTSVIRSVNQLDLRNCTGGVLELRMGSTMTNGRADVLLMDSPTDTNQWVPAASGTNALPEQDVRLDLTAVPLQGGGTRNYTGTQVYLGFGAVANAGNTGAPSIDDIKVSCAPNVLTGSDVDYISGSSAATAMVSGAAVLAASQYPGANPSYLKSNILGSVTPTASLASKTVTGGRLNVRGVLDTTGPSAPGLTGPANGFGSTDARPTFAWNGSTDDRTGISAYQLFIDGAAVATTGADGRSAQPPTALALGSHTWRVDAIDGAGNRAGSETRTVIVSAGPPPPPIGDVTAPVLSTKITKLTRKTAAKKGFTIDCTLKEAGTCAVTLTVSAADAKKLKLKVKKGAKSLTLKKATKKVGSSGKVKVAVKPSAKIRKAIGKAKKKVTYIFKVTATDLAGNKKTKTTKLKL